MQRLRCCAERNAPQKHPITPHSSARNITQPSQRGLVAKFRRPAGHPPASRGRAGRRHRAGRSHHSRKTRGRPESGGALLVPRVRSALTAAARQGAAARIDQSRCSAGLIFCRIAPGLFHSGSNPRPGGGIGRHARLRIWCRKTCRFESCPGHQIVLVPKSAVWRSGCRVDQLLLRASILLRVTFSLYPMSWRAYE